VAVEGGLNIEKNTTKKLNNAIETRATIDHNNNQKDPFIVIINKGYLIFFQIIFFIVSFISFLISFIN